MAMTDEELAAYGMRRVGNTFSQTTGNPQLAAPATGSAVAVDTRPNWTAATPRSAPSIPVGQATELGLHSTPAPGSIPVGQATEQFGARPVTGQQFPGESPRGFSQTSAPIRETVPFEEGKFKAPVQAALAQEGRLAKLGRAVGPSARLAANSLIGPVYGYGLNAAADKYLAPDQASEPGMGPASSAAVAQIPGQAPDVVAPPPQKPSWFRDTEVGRNVGNAVNATTGGLPTALFRAGSTASLLEPIAVGALRGATAASVARTAPDGLNPPPQIPANNAQGQPGGSMPGAGQPVAPVAAPEETQKGVLTTGQVSAPFDTTEPNLRAAAIYDEMAASRARTDGGDASGGSWIGHTSGDDTRRRNAHVDLSNKLDTIRSMANNTRNPMARAAIMSHYAQLAGQDTDTGRAERLMGMRERGETLRSIAANNTNRQIHAADNAVSLRNNENTVQGSLLGHKMTNAFNWANIQREQANADRTNANGRVDAANAQGNAEASARIASAKELQDRFTNLIPAGADGKPDTATGARYAAGADVAVANILKNPNLDPTVRKALETKGAGALGAAEVARIHAGMQLADVVNATATGGLTPWGTTAVVSNAPIMAIRKNANGDYETDRRGPNGEKEIIPARYVEKEGGIFSGMLGGRSSNKFKILMEQ